MLIIQVYFKGDVFQSEIKLVTHCYIRLLCLRIVHLILHASGPSIICDFIISVASKKINVFKPKKVNSDAFCHKIKL